MTSSFLPKLRMAAIMKKSWWPQLLAHNAFIKPSSVIEFSVRVPARYVAIAIPFVAIQCCDVYMACILSLCAMTPYSVDDACACWGNIGMYDKTTYDKYDACMSKVM